jgi:hypothetical protein
MSSQPATSIMRTHKRPKLLNARLIYTFDDTLNGRLRAAVFSKNRASL